MRKAPIPFNGSYHTEGTAPKPHEDYSKMIKDPKTLEREQSGGQYDQSWNAHSQASGSPLPCGCYQKVHYKPNKPTCHPWNTPGCSYGQGSSCGMGCSTCSGSDPCLNYPYSYATAPADYTPGAPGPFCVMDRSLTSVPKEQAPAEAEGEGEVKEGFSNVCQEKLQKCFKQRAHHPPAYVPYYSQQCSCDPASGCAGSSTDQGCGCKCPQSGGVSGNGCTDCQHYYRAHQTYRQILKGGSIYPFCNQ